MSREAWIIEAVRSPRGKGKDTGALHDVHPQRILAQVLNGLRDRVGFDTSEVDDVIMGNGSGTGDHGLDIARNAVLDAGWSLDAPGVTLTRHCGSGQQAVTFAAMAVISGHQDLVVGGGIESMSRPTSQHVDGFTANNKHLFEQYPMVPQGISADMIATLEGFTREQCDALGIDSQNRAAVALAEGRFDRSLIPIFHNDGRLALDKEEFPRPGTTMADLAKLTASFEKSMVRPLSRHGVPVLKRASSKPQAVRLSLIPSAEASPARPPTVLASPVCMIALRNVPVVRITAAAR